MGSKGTRRKVETPDILFEQWSGGIGYKAKQWSKGVMEELARNGAKKNADPNWVNFGYFPNQLPGMIAMLKQRLEWYQKNMPECLVSRGGGGVNVFAGKKPVKQAVPAQGVGAVDASATDDDIPF